MQLAVTLNQIESIGPFRRSGADVFVVGVHGLTHRFGQTFSLETLSAVQTNIHAAGGVMWVALNGLYHPKQLPLLEATLDALAKTPPTRILFADTAVYVLAKARGLANRLIYHSETYVSAAADLFFWQEQGIAGVVPGRETTLTDLLQMGSMTPLPLTWVGHGYINMFHSRRPLIHHYLDHTGFGNQDAFNAKPLDLYETTREEAFPILEDVYGTHIFRAKPLASFQELPKLLPILETMIIQSLFMSQEEVMAIISDYRSGLDGAELGPLIDRYQGLCDSGFYYKETVLEKQREVKV